MPQKNETTIIIISLLILSGILGGGYWWFTQKSEENSQQILSETSPLLSPPSPTDTGTFPIPTTVSPGTRIRIDGSTKMISLNQGFKNGFEQQFPDTQVITNAKGSNHSLKLLLQGKIDIAAISRPLTAAEKTQKLVAIPVIELANPDQRSLYYVYQQPPSEAVKAFLGYALSPTGQQMINNVK